MAGSKRILLLGGYGKAGTPIAQLLVDYSHYSITIGGRRKHKAQKTALAMNRRVAAERCNGIKLDITDIAALERLLPEYDLLINCVPMSPNCEALIRAIANAGIHYLDLIPSPVKRAQFEKYATIFAHNNKTCVLEAGWEPGLPAFLTRLGAKKLNDGAKDIELQAIYREKGMSNTSVADIIEHASLTAPFLQGGSWIQKSILRSKTMYFPESFGKITGYPTELAELRVTASELGLHSLKLYQGGYNPVCDFILFVWTALGMRKNKYLKSVGVSLFQWANSWFSTPPFGGVIKAKVKGNGNSLQVMASTEDLYRATAIPVVAAAKQIMAGIIHVAGVHFMGAVVELELFQKEIKKMGMSVEVQRNNGVKHNLAQD